MKLGVGDGGGEVRCDVKKTETKSLENPEKKKKHFQRNKGTSSTQGWKQLQNPHGWRLQGQS